MVEVEKRPVEFLTFTTGEKTAQVERKDIYKVKDATNTLASLGIKQHTTRTYKIINHLVPNSTISNPNDRRVLHSLSQEDLTKIIEYSIQDHESRNTQNVRPYAIDTANETIIELRGITDYKWRMFEPLLDMLRTTREQTESGETQIIPMPYVEVQEFFPEDTPTKSIHTAFLELNTALAPNGWSIMRKGEGPRKPIDAPWFLRGPDDNGLQSTRNPVYAQLRREYNKSVAEQRSETAEKRFDHEVFETSLLLHCVSNLSNPYAKATFTKNPVQAMTSILTADVRLQKIIGDEIPPLEFFKKSIEGATKRMRGKTREELSEIQEKILPMWNRVRIDYGQHPKTVIFEHFSQPDYNIPLDQKNNDTGNLEADTITPKRTQGSRGKNKEAIPGRLKNEATVVLLEADGNKIYGLYKNEREILRLLINASKDGPISRTELIELCKTNGLTKLKVSQFNRYLSTIKDALLESLYYIEISKPNNRSNEESDYRFTKKPPHHSA